MTELEKAAEAREIGICQYSTKDCMTTNDCHRCQWGVPSLDFRCSNNASFKLGAKWQAEQSPWISVEERLPEYTQYDKKRYVAKVEYGSMIKEYQTAIVWMQNKFKFNIEMDWVKVTHWMEIKDI